MSFRKIDGTKKPSVGLSVSYANRVELIVDLDIPALNTFYEDRFDEYKYYFNKENLSLTVQMEDGTAIQLEDGTNLLLEA